MAIKICPCCGMENDASEQNCQLCNFEFDQLDTAQVPNQSLTKKDQSASTQNTVSMSYTNPSSQKSQNPNAVLQYSGSQSTVPSEQPPAAKPPAADPTAPPKPVRYTYTSRETVRSEDSDDVFFSADKAFDEDDSDLDLNLFPDEEEKKRSRLILIVGSVITLVIFIAVLIFVIPWSKKEKKGESLTDNTPIQTEDTAMTKAVTQASEIISNGFVDTHGKDYVTIYQSADTGSGIVARVHTGDELDIYQIDSGWFQVGLEDVMGYLEADYVSFSKPEQAVETTEQMTESAKADTTEAATQTAVPVKPTANATIEVDTSGGGDGATFYLKVSGSYAYYVYEVWAYLYDGTESEYLGKNTSSESKVYLTAGSVISYVTAKVTPYHADGTVGETVTCRGDLVYDDPTPQGASVATCTKYGQINTHGGVVAGFTTSYVVNNGASAHVRDSLGNAWHVTAVNYCYSRGVNWYELYDTDDGDYYGWVDENYIDFN